MADDHHDAVFIRFGQFQAGAYGRLGIFALIAILLTATRYFNLW